MTVKNAYSYRDTTGVNKNRNMTRYNSRCDLSTNSDSLTLYKVVYHQIL